MPLDTATPIRERGHDVWTAYEAHLESARDDEILAYAADKAAIAVTNNKDCAHLARRMCTTRVVYLKVSEAVAVEAMNRALDWFEGPGNFPAGRVLRVPRRAAITVMKPLPM